MNPMIQLKKGTSIFVIAFLLELSRSAQAVIPAPDGGYPGFNTAEGQNALFSLDVTNGFGNTAVGWFSQRLNVDGNFNTATGVGSLLFNTADANTAFGAGALLFNTTGFLNTGNGYQALHSNTTGNRNTADGVQALYSNTTGNDNTANGYGALVNNITGHLNTASGYLAGLSLTGVGNVCIGANVSGVAGADNNTWIRNINTTFQDFSAGVNNYVTVRMSDGRLGQTAVVSSRRYKEDIKPLAAASQALYALKPVSFRLKKDFDPTQALGFGLIAEEVQKVDRALVYRNDKGQVESVRYEMVNAMLLNEFLKEHRKVQELEAAFRALNERLEDQDAKIQKVSAQLELSKPARQTVLNNQ